MSSSQHDPVIRAVGAVVREHLEAIAASLKSHADRLAKLESGPANLADAYAGTFDADRMYSRGQLVTASGSLWFVLHPSSGERPGKSANFRLIVKGGG